MDGDVSVWTGTPEQIAETMIAYRRSASTRSSSSSPAPYDDETMETLIKVVKPRVEETPIPA